MPFKLALNLMLVLALLNSASAQRKEPGSEAELMAITERGRILWEYDTAAWYSSDAVQALSPAEGSVRRYVGRRTDNGWVVAYGRLNEQRDKFLVAYEATQQSTPKDFKVIKHDPPLVDNGFYLAAANALETAIAAFSGGGRPYNAAVLPAPKNQFWVYLVPAQTDTKVWPLGADVRYLISGDGLRIVETRPLHKSIIEYDSPKQGETREGGFHTAVLDELPEDTDVFLVLSRKPSVSEWVATRTYIYRIDLDGKINYIMTAEKFFKLKNPE
jgi:hypothetical protein